MLTPPTNVSGGDTVVMQPETRAKLKDFADTQLNKDVLLLSLQGCTLRQMATNLSVGHGTVQAIVIKANDILGNDGALSTAALGESLRAMQYQQQLKQILSDCLSAQIKAGDTPCSAHTHLNSAIAALYGLVPDYEPQFEDSKEALEWALKEGALLRGEEN